MRIALCVPRRSHIEPGLSGDKTYTSALLAGLAARGHEVKIVSPINVRKFWRGQVPASQLVSQAIGVRREIRNFSPDAWLVYDSAPKNPDLFGWWQRPKRYVPMIFEAGVGGSVPRRWRWLFAFAFRRSLHRADMIIAERPIVADGLHAMGIAQERVRVLPPGIMTYEELPARAAARQHLGLPSQNPILLCVSRLSTERSGQGSWKTESVVALLRALTALPSECLLLLVGDGPGRAQVESEVAALQLGERVRLAGAVSHEDVKWFYAACDLFAYPAATDRILNVVLEAQACGRAIVGLRTASMEVTVDDGRTGLLARNLDEFKEYVAMLVAKPAMRESMGQAAREYILRFHSIERRIRQIEEMLLAEA